MATERMDHPLAFENHDEENKSLTSPFPIKPPNQHRIRSATSIETRHVPPRKSLPPPPKQLQSEAVDEDPLSKHSSSPETPGLLPFIHRFLIKEDKTNRTNQTNDEPPSSNLAVNGASPPILTPVSVTGNIIQTGSSTSTSPSTSLESNSSSPSLSQRTISISNSVDPIMQSGSLDSLAKSDAKEEVVLRKSKSSAEFRDLEEKTLESTVQDWFHDIVSKNPLKDTIFKHKDNIPSPKRGSSFADIFEEIGTHHDKTSEFERKIKQSFKNKAVPSLFPDMEPTPKELPKKQPLPFDDISFKSGPGSLAPEPTKPAAPRKNVPSIKSIKSIKSIDYTEGMQKVKNVAQALIPRWISDFVVQLYNEEHCRPLFYSCVVAAWFVGILCIVFLLFQIKKLQRQRKRKHNKHSSHPPQSVPMKHKRHTMKIEKQQGENIVWLNLLVTEMWKHLSQPFAATTREKLKSLLEYSFNMKKPTAVETVNIEQINFGDISPTFSNIQGSKPPHLDYSCTFDCLYTGPAQIIVDVAFGGKAVNLKVPVAIEKFTVKGQMRVDMVFCSKAPFLHTLTYSFLHLPEIALSIKPLRAINLMDIPFLENWLIESINSLVQTSMVLPEQISILWTPTAPSPSGSYDELTQLESQSKLHAEGTLPSFYDNAADFSGLLFLRIVEAKLSSDAVEGITTMFCVIGFDQDEFVTASLKKTRNPQWNELFEFGVAHNADRRLTITLKGKDIREASRSARSSTITATTFTTPTPTLAPTAEEFIGACVVDFFNVTTDTRDLWIPLDSPKLRAKGKEVGKMRIQLKFIPTTSIPTIIGSNTFV